MSCVICEVRTTDKYLLLWLVVFNNPAAQAEFASIENSGLPGGDIPQRVIEFHVDLALIEGRDNGWGFQGFIANLHLGSEGPGWWFARDPINACSQQFIPAQLFLCADDERILQ